MNFSHTHTKQAKNEMNIVLDSSSSSTDEDDNSNISEIWDIDDEAEIDDDEEVAWPFEKNVPKFIVRDGEQVTLTSNDYHCEVKL